MNALEKEGEIDRYVPDQRLTNHNSQMGDRVAVGDSTSSASNDHIILIFERKSFMRRSTTAKIQAFCIVWMEQWMLGFGSLLA